MSASETDMNDKQKIEWALFLLRLGIFIVMFIWVIEKFINPDHLVRNLAYSIIPTVSAKQSVISWAL